jgi:hypothetical protein
MRWRLIPIIAAVTLGCRAEPSPFRAVADVKQLMAAVLEPAADEYWDAVGTIVDESGSHDFAPQSDEDWNAVTRNAYVIAESGNLLMMGSRARDQAEWITFSEVLISAGKKALDAALARDKDAVFNAGAEVYEACTRCHAIYAAGLNRPTVTPPADSEPAIVAPTPK